VKIVANVYRYKSVLSGTWHVVAAKNMSADAQEYPGAKSGFWQHQNTFDTEADAMAFGRKIAAAGDEIDPAKSVWLYLSESFALALSNTCGFQWASADVGAPIVIGQRVINQMVGKRHKRTIIPAGKSFS